MAAGAVRDDGAETDAENLGPEECSAEFFDFLVHLKMHGKLSARDVCILSCWACGAGVQGKGASLAVKPSRTGGGFSEKFDGMLGLTIQGDFCDGPALGMPRSTFDRTTVPCHGAYVYEDLAKEISETPGSEKLLRDQVLAGDWSPPYEKHPVVQVSSRSTSMACHSNAGIRSLVTGSSTCSRVGGTCSSRWRRRTVFTRTATRDNGTQWNPGERVTDSE